MKPLAALLSVLRARWFWSFVGAAILGLLVWFFGDLLGIADRHPLDSPVVRLLVILGIALAWGIWNLLAQARARRGNDTLVAALAQPAGDEPGGAEITELDRRFAVALNQLKRSRFGKAGSRRWLYQLPWYVMIGPPGSGKSTALAQSGLRLRLGQIQELRGAGGTRHCDWVFTDEAVLIDTAGRYTTQDSDAKADKAAWLGFLDLLKKRRPRQPLNGLLVALAAKDLTPDGGIDHAALIRGRLEEVESRIGMRLPVYLLITKTDLIAGFEPFFDNLNETQREQVWGYTFDHHPGQTDRPVLEGLPEALAELVARLDRRMLDRLAAEPDLDRRARIFSFPAQVASLSGDITRFVDRCFHASQYEGGGWLRGVYLTSATQSGTPIDRLLAAVGQSIGATVSPAATASGDRSFFLRRLLEGVIFNEASLAGRDLAGERKAWLLRGGALAACVLVAAGALGAWTWSFAGNRNRYDRLETDLAQWSQQARPLIRVRLTAADADFSTVLPLLDRLDAIKAPLGQADLPAMRVGLSQRAVTQAELEAGYRGGLVNLLLPRLVLAAERDLQAHVRDPDYLVEGLKVYLALAGSAPVDADLLQAWFTFDMQGRRPDLIASTQRHVTALAAILPELELGSRPTLNKPVLMAAQAAVGQVSLPKRAYNALLSNPALKRLPGWKLTDHAGPNATSILVRRSKQPLGAEIPAIFTYDGFQQVFLPQLDQVARGAYAEYWVLRDEPTPAVTDAALRALQADMLKLYYDDDIAAWDGLLHDVTLTPIATLDQAVDATKALSGPGSPLKLLIQAIVHETALTVPPEPAAAEGQTPLATAIKAAQKSSPGLGRLAALIRPANAAPAEVPGAPVEAHFAPLRRLVEGANGAPPALDEALATLAALHAKLADAAASPIPGDALAKMGNSAAMQVAAAAKALPDPLKEMLGRVGGSATGIVGSGALSQLNKAWRTDVLPLCQAAINGRYPFAPASDADAATEDLVRLFAPAGLIPSFVKEQLGPLVDTTQQPWRDTQNIGLQRNALAMLARAQKITMALFPGGMGPKASFSLLPTSLDDGAASAALTIDNQELHYAHGPARPAPFTWPGPGGTNSVRLSFTMFNNEAPVATSNEGPWAVFRLLHARGFQPTGQPDVFKVELGAGQHVLSLQMRAASVENPFDLRLLSGFACPGTL